MTGRWGDVHARELFAAMGWEGRLETEPKLAAASAASPISKPPFLPIARPVVRRAHVGSVPCRARQIHDRGLGRHRSERGRIGRNLSEKGTGQERQEAQHCGEQPHKTPWQESNHLNDKSLAHSGNDVKVADPAG
jgi:hypothetical protein